jgi:phosphonate transport system substrate-binding protein
VRKKGYAVFILFIALIMLAACGEDTSNSEEANASPTKNDAEITDKDQSDWPETLRFAATGIEGLEELQLEFDPFREKLEEVLDMEVEFFALSDRTTAITALEYDQVDIVMSGGAEYVLMKSADENTQPVAALTRPGYLPVIISHEDSGIETIEDLKGKSIAMNDVGSTSAYLMPSKMLIDEGFDIEQDVDLHLLGDAMYGAFLAEETDALALTQLNYEGLVEDEGDRFNVVAQGDLLPNDLIVASPHLSESFVQHLQDHIIENGDELMEQILITGENDKFSESEFVVAEDSDYDGLRDAYELLGVDYE